MANNPANHRAHSRRMQYGEGYLDGKDNRPKRLDSDAYLDGYKQGQDWRRRFRMRLAEETTGILDRAEQLAINEQRNRMMRGGRASP